MSLLQSYKYNMGFFLMRYSWAQKSGIRHPVAVVNQKFCNSISVSIVTARVMSLSKRQGKEVRNSTNDRVNEWTNIVMNTVKYCVVINQKRR